MVNCRECRSNLVAYLHRELSPARRREIALHLDTCQGCYAAYIEQRDLSHELAQILPRLGNASAPHFERVWNAFQAERAGGRTPDAAYPARYGLAALLFMLALLFPWSLNRGEIIMAAPPTQPSPALQTITATPGVARPAAVSQTPGAAPHQAPLVDATSTP